MTTSANSLAQQRAQDYVRGRLTEREREVFELEMVDQPELMDALEVEIALQQGLRHVPARRASRATRFVERLSMPMALAASLAIGIGLGTILNRNNADGSAPATLAGLYVDQVRGEPRLPEANTSEQAIVLELPIRYDDPVRVRLIAPDGHALPEQHARPDTQGLVRLLLQARQQIPGTWQLEIESDGHQVDRRQFELRPPQ
ncbi:hypothetical protein [Ahniella affigens]|nr:hypothetical protein [Ahniella affigens]